YDVRSANATEPSGLTDTSVNVASSLVSFVTASDSRSTRNTGPRPSSSADTSRPVLSGSQTGCCGQRSQLSTSVRGSPPASATSWSVTRGASCGVDTVSRTYATHCPSGLTAGD